MSSLIITYKYSYPSSSTHVVIYIYIFVIIIKINSIPFFRVQYRCVEGTTTRGIERSNKTWYMAFCFGALFFFGFCCWYYNRVVTYYYAPILIILFTSVAFPLFVSLLTIPIQFRAVRIVTYQYCLVLDHFGTIVVTMVPSAQTWSTYFDNFSSRSALLQRRHF